MAYGALLIVNIGIHDVKKTRLTSQSSRGGEMKGKKLLVLFFALGLLIVACSTQPQTSCMPDKVRNDPDFGTFRFNWNEWDGHKMSYKVARSTFKPLIQDGKFIVLLDKVNGEKNVEMLSLDIKKIDILLVPFVSTEEDQTIKVQYFAVGQKCGKMFFDDKSTKTN